MSDVECIHKCSAMPDVSNVAHADNRSVSACVEAVQGEICDMSCAEGYTRQGILACEGGKWTTTAVQCVQECSSMPDVTNVTHVDSDSVSLCGGAMEGAVCDMTCAEGYARQGVLTCMGGTWNVSGVQCALHNGCSAIPDVSTVAHASNHSVSLCAEAVAGSVCNMTCVGGTHAKGRWSVLVRVGTCPLFDVFSSAPLYQTSPAWFTPTIAL